MSRAIKKTGICLLAVLLLSAGLFAWYVQDDYDADTQAKEALQSDDTVQTEVIEDGYFFDGPGTDRALIFYPGGKVECEAYAPLMRELAAEGLDCFLLHVPCNLAVLAPNRAEKIRNGAWTYDSWYVGGHSLGGAMAASWAAKHEEELDGLIFLAAYSEKELPAELRVLSIYGSEDGVLNREKLGQQGEQLQILGGNHAGFGNYGDQKGDGTARISRQEQQAETAAAILEFTY